MKHLVSCKWNSILSFDANIDGHTVKLDATVDAGGQNTGVSPKKLLLAGLAGCTGMDVVSILNKMKQPVSLFSIDIEAELSDEHPRIYTSITVTYRFKESDNLDKTKVEKAINLSKETYCGVGAMLSKSSEIKYKALYS